MAGVICVDDAMTQQFYQPLGCPRIDTTERTNRETTGRQLVQGLALRLADRGDASEFCATRRDEYLWRVFGSGDMVPRRLPVFVSDAKPTHDRPLGHRKE
jgi:hypothetical protein